MFPPSHTPNHPSLREFFDISNEKTFSFNLPFASHTSRHCGSSHGWLVYVYDTPMIVLLNPFTQARRQLPSVVTFPNVVSYDRFNRYRVIHRPIHGPGIISDISAGEMRNHFIKKVVLSANPSENGNFMAMAIVSSFTYVTHTTLAFYNGTDYSWIFLDEGLSDWCDVVFQDGRFYAVDIKGNIGVCDVQNQHFPNFYIIAITGEFPDHGQLECWNWFKQVYVHYLVFSSNELLLVSRHINRTCRRRVGTRKISEWTMSFDLYKMDWSLSQWEKVESLGDQMLFVGQNASLSFSASDWTRCLKNSIYFTDAGIITIHGAWKGTYVGASCGVRDRRLSGIYKYDSGVYKLCDGSIDRFDFYPSKKVKCSPPPIWVSANPL